MLPRSRREVCSGHAMARPHHTMDVYGAGVRGKIDGDNAHLSVVSVHAPLVPSTNGKRSGGGLSVEKCIEDMGGPWRLRASARSRNQREQTRTRLRRSRHRSARNRERGADRDRVGRGA